MASVKSYDMFYIAWVVFVCVLFGSIAGSGFT